MKKKSSILVYPLIALGFLLILAFGCKKDDDYKNPIETGTVTDIEGSVYKTVKIGDQWWMAENLKVTKYRNGDTIPNVTDGTVWYNLTTGAYCDYENTASNSAVYGKLYNWYAVADSRNIAPTGWHIATDAEWTTLTTFLGGSDAGGKLKEKGTAHWLSPNLGATNETGFSVLPAGGRYPWNFSNLGDRAEFWSSTERNGAYAWARTLYNGGSHVFRYYDMVKSDGRSVRCLKD